TNSTSPLHTAATTLCPFPYSSATPRACLSLLFLTRRPPTSPLFPTRRSSDLGGPRGSRRGCRGETGAHRPRPEEREEVIPRPLVQLDPREIDGRLGKPHVERLERLDENV